MLSPSEISHRVVKLRHMLKDISPEIAVFLFLYANFNYNINFSLYSIQAIKSFAEAILYL